MLQWFNARTTVDLGNALADKFAAQISENSTEHAQTLLEVLHHTDGDHRGSRLNRFKRAKLANTFRWRLLEKGIDKQLADKITEQLLLHLTLNGSAAVPRGDAAPKSGAAAVAPAVVEAANPEELLARGNRCLEQGAYTEAVAIYRELIGCQPRHAEGLGNLGAALFKLGSYGEAEALMRKAIEIEPNHDDALANLGTLLRARGRTAESESSLRRALTINPANADADVSLGATLLLLGRIREAKGKFEQALESEPQNVNALLGLAQIARMEGRFEEATTTYGRILAIHPKLPCAWAALVGLCKMTAADRDWLDTAEEIAASGLAPLDESDMRFAIGKYFDDIKDYADAFESYHRANELRKTAVARYVPEERTHRVDLLIRNYTQEKVAKATGGSPSERPVLVVGMLRSGTSLAEQIIASHPAVHGGGELLFWADAAREHAGSFEQGVLDEPARKLLAEQYLCVLGQRSADALRVVDKTPFNCDYLGPIHTVFPNARVIYLRRDPIDACLSCYFQQFSAALNFTMDLSDLAHYYREHQRLMAHWRRVLPEGTMLEVPYEQLVSDPNRWMHEILEFLGLEWNDRCLDFNQTQRLVPTASYWQVRQRVYKSSVARWRHYEKFIGPLLQLKA